MNSLAINHLDETIIVLDKPSGLLSVPGRGQEKQDCLYTRVQALYPEALIVHRLDMATSGLIIMARGKVAQRHLSIQFQARQVDKRYIAIVAGSVENDCGIIDLPLIRDWPNRPRQMVDRLNGKPSTTHYRTLERDARAATTRLELRPITGRSHQLRVHLATLGHPILGDCLYGLVPTITPGIEPYIRLMLHASQLELSHPVTGTTIRLSSKPPF